MEYGQTYDGLPYTPGAVVLGLLAAIACFVRFVTEGRGTPAPLAPTEQLVVGGLYRFVRNPMYVAVASMIAGQALLFRSVSWRLQTPVCGDNAQRLSTRSRPPAASQVKLAA